MDAALSAARKDEMAMVAVAEKKKGKARKPGKAKIKAKKTVKAKAKRARNTHSFCITMERGLLKQVDSKVGKGSRSAWIGQAVARALGKK